MEHLVEFLILPERLIDSRINRATRRNPRDATAGEIFESRRNKFKFRSQFGQEVGFLAWGHTLQLVRPSPGEGPGGGGGGRRRRRRTVSCNSGLEGRALPDRDFP